MTQATGRLGAPRVVLALLCLLYLILFVDRVNIATAAPLIKADLGLSNTQLGLAFSAFAIPYALFQLIGGWIGDKLGPRLTLSACCAMVGLSTMLTGAASGFVSLFALRLALGFAQGAAFPTATRAMSTWIPVRDWGFAQGIAHSFGRIGNAVTPPLMAALLLFLSWRRSFVILGLVSLVWLLAWAWYFRNDPREHPGITEADLAALPEPANRSRPRDSVVAARAAHLSCDDGRLLLRLDAVVVLELDSRVFLRELSSEPAVLRNVLGRCALCGSHRRHGGRCVDR